jgi:hypothetical protein
VPVGGREAMSIETGEDRVAGFIQAHKSISCRT